jgi:hypothetical protein
MINPNISELLGFAYETIEDDGSLAVIGTPFVFEDGDPIVAYVEETDGRIRFFDDGELVWHFMGRGVPLDEPGESKFIADLAAPYGVSLNEEHELEIWANAGQESAAFAQYMSAMLEMVRWERNQTNAERRRRQALTADAENIAETSA